MNIYFIIQTILLLLFQFVSIIGVMFIGAVFLVRQNYDPIWMYILGFLFGLGAHLFLDICFDMSLSDIIKNNLHIR